MTGVFFSALRASRAARAAATHPVLEVGRARVGRRVCESRPAVREGGVRGVDVEGVGAGTLRHPFRVVAGSAWNTGAQKTVSSRMQPPRKIRRKPRGVTRRKPSPRCNWQACSGQPKGHRRQLKRRRKRLITFVLLALIFGVLIGECCNFVGCEAITRR